MSTNILLIIISVSCGGIITFFLKMLYDNIRDKKWDGVDRRDNTFSIRDSIESLKGDIHMLFDKFNDLSLKILENYVKKDDFKEVEKIVYELKTEIRLLQDQQKKDNANINS